MLCTQHAQRDAWMEAPVRKRLNALRLRNMRAVVSRHLQRRLLQHTRRLEHKPQCGQKGLQASGVNVGACSAPASSQHACVTGTDNTMP